MFFPKNFIFLFSRKNIIQEPATTNAERNHNVWRFLAFETASSTLLFINRAIKNQTEINIMKRIILFTNENSRIFLIKRIPRGSASGCRGKIENLRFS